jgi:hypothetical protein
MTAGTIELAADAGVEMLPGYRVDPWYGTTAWVTLPWPESQAEKDALIASSLGPAVIDWAEGRGEGPGLVDYQTGGPWQYTPGQKRFLILWYAYDDRGRFTYRRGAKRGAKGTGKDPFGASICLAELVGPTQLVLDADGWHGEAHGMPLVQIASNSEAQSKDVLRIANALCSKGFRSYHDLDCGETRTIIRGSGGRIEVLTASESSAEGDPATFVFLNETHHMTESNGGHRIAKVVGRNVGKSPAHLQARRLDGTNAHQQGGDSIAERTYMAWQAQVAGKTARGVDILYDSIEAPPTTDLFNEASRQAGLRAAYADAPWADLERLDGEVLDPETPVADSIRYYMNGLAAAEDAWVDPRKISALARPAIRIATGTQIAMFLDCSKSGDVTALMASRLSDGFVQKLGAWVPPRGAAGKGWLVDRELVDGAVRGAWNDYKVVWFGVDPSPAKDDETELNYWMPLADAWHRDFHKRLKVWATGGAKVGHSVLFDMRIKTLGGAARNQQFVAAAMQTQDDIDETGTFLWDGDPLVLAHFQQAKGRPTPWGRTLGKVTRDSSKHVDCAVAAVGARMGRRIVLNSGKVRARSARAGGSGRAVF